MLRQLMAAMAAVACLLGSASAPAGEAVYRFSPVNQYDINLTAAYWNPITLDSLAVSAHR